MNRALAFCIASVVLIGPCNAAGDISEQEKSRILDTLPPDDQKVLRSPPYCWEYAGPRHEWPKQGEWTQADLDAFLSYSARQTQRWIESIGRNPPLTCEEYEKPDG